MASSSLRQSIDWEVILGDRALQPTPLAGGFAGELAALVAAFDALRATDRVDDACRRAVELARSQVGLRAVSLFLLDDEARRLRGTWGTNPAGELVEEHDLVVDVDTRSYEAFHGAEHGRPFMVLENSPLAAQREPSSRVRGADLVACTPIRWGRERLGMLVNDAGWGDTPVDEPKQALAAILCRLLAGTIVVARSRAEGPPPSQRPPRASHPAVRKALGMLARDPALVGKEMAAPLGISASRLARLFKAEVGMSLVEYRNRARIERARELVEGGEHRLLEVARVAGFGSYAQFHRVFRATHGTSPREYLRAR